MISETKDTTSSTQIISVVIEMPIAAVGGTHNRQRRRRELDDKSWFMKLLLWIDLVFGIICQDLMILPAGFRIFQVTMK